jgi:hypothetical protein
MGVKQHFLLAQPVKCYFLPKGGGGTLTSGVRFHFCVSRFGFGSVVS